MYDGFYTADVTSSVGLQGFSVFTLLNGRIWGGDSSFVITGSYLYSEESFVAKLHCQRANNYFLGSVFGDFDDYHLTVKGTPNRRLEEFTLVGQMDENPDMRISAKITRKVDFNNL